MKSVAVFSVKGGVGKTTLAVNLGFVAATQSARRTLLWDLDAQGAATYALRVDARPGLSARKVFAGDAELQSLIQPSRYERLDMLPADRSLRHLDRQLGDDDKAKRLKKMLRALDLDYDRVLLDCPPGLTELADQVFRAVDVLVVPMLPSPLSMRAYDQLREHLAREPRKGLIVLPVFTMVDRRRTLHKRTVDGVVGALTIPYASAIEQMGVDQAPIGARTPGSVPARAFGAVWTAIETALAGQGA